MNLENIIALLASLITIYTFIKAQIPLISAYKKKQNLKKSVTQKINVSPRSSCL